MLVAQVSKFGKPEELIEVVEQSDPGVPGADEAFVATEFFPINPADVLNLEGGYGATPPKLPMIPGAEGVGRIVRVGADVTHLKAGDRVLLPGPGHGVSAPSARRQLCLRCPRASIRSSSPCCASTRRPRI